MPARRTSHDNPVLIVLAGLPGVGKTSIARHLARVTGAFHLRIDSIEHVLAMSTPGIDPVGDAGYLTAYAIARDNLFGSQTVVADSVNPVAATRMAWLNVARESGATALEIEIVCSDRALHHERVETRESDIPGMPLPTWTDVLARDYEPFAHDHTVIDTAALSAEQAADRIKDLIAAA